MTNAKQKQPDQEQKRPEDGFARLILYLKTKNPKVETLMLASELGLRTPQQKFRFKQATDIDIHLPAGKYNIKVVALEHRPAQLVVLLKAGRTTRHRIYLKPEKAPQVPSFQERLKAYGLNSKQAVTKLNLKEREHRVVNNKEGQPGVVRLKAKSLDNIKQWIGAPFGVYTHHTPMFGDFKVSKETLDRLRKKGVSPKDHEELNSLVKEFLYGNERANAQILKELKPMLVDLVVGDFWHHLYNELTIPAGATYEFGPGTLIVDRLRIHTTGKLVPVGECKFDIGHWEEFS